MRFICLQEGHYTRTEFNISLGKKITWSMFINTALIPLVVDVFIKSRAQNVYGVLFKEGRIILKDFINNQ